MGFYEELVRLSESEEGEKLLQDISLKYQNEERIRLTQLERLKEKGSFIEFTEKVIKKYSSEEYKFRCYNRTIEPPEDLYFFLFEYAEKYGRKCNPDEYKTYGNMFTAAIYYCDGYYFNLMNGQGAAIIITKEK